MFCWQLQKTFLVGPGVYICGVFWFEDIALEPWSNLRLSDFGSSENFMSWTLESGYAVDVVVVDVVVDVVVVCSVVVELADVIYSDVVEAFVEAFVVVVVVDVVDVVVVYVVVVEVVVVDIIVVVAASNEQ